MPQRAPPSTFVSVELADVFQWKSNLNCILKIIAGTLLTSVLGGCSSLIFAGINSLSGDSRLRTTTDVEFDPAHSLSLDVFSPQGASAAPVVVFFYGGYWRSGDRGQYRWVGEALAREGLFAMLPDYRKFPSTGLDGFMADAASAVAWARAHAAEHGGDPDRIVLMGHSAGAHLAALLATDASWLGAHQIKPKDLCGVVGLAGPYDFLPLTGRSLIEIFGTERGEQLRSQPTNFVNGDEPPMLLLHGAADTTVGQHNTANLARKLEAAGVKVSTRIYPEIKHVGMLLALSGRFAKEAPVMADSLEFIRACE